MAPAPFAGFAVPPTPYLVGLVVGTVILVAMLYSLQPPITQRTVLALVPWAFVGSALHVFHQLGGIYRIEIFPPLLEPLFAAPAVYLTTFIVAGTVWVLSIIVGTAMGGASRTDNYFGATGAGIAIALFGLLAWQGLDPQVGPIRLVVPAVSLAASAIVTFVVYMLLGAWRTYVVAEARLAGALVLFAHVLDGITTAIGTDVLGVGERSVLPARIMEFAGDLPTAEYLGVGWLFVLVKIVVAVGIVWLFADYVSEEPREGNLLFAVVMLVGLGPALNNLLLFFVGVP